MGLFGSGGDKKKPIPNNKPIFTKPVDPGWVFAPEGGFYRFLDLDPEDLNLDGVGGIYLIWHAGVRPQWVYVDDTRDMASSFHTAGNISDITQYETNGGLFVSWAPVREEYRKGVVKYIEQNFKTLVSNDSGYNDQTRPVPVIPPLISTSR